MKTYKQLTEAKKSTIVMGFGRLSPPTAGHELLVKAIMALAQKNNADHVLYLSRTQDAKKNPLTVDQKVYYARQSFKGANIVGASDKIRTFIEAAKSLTGKYDNLIMVAGSDRVLEYKTLLDRYNGKDFSFKTIHVVSAGERDPDADGASGMSATKMRQAASDNNFAKFKQGVPTGMSSTVAKKMFDDVRAGMNLTEETSVREDFINDRIFNVGDIVEYNEQKLAIEFRGTNYVVLEGGSQVWLHEIKPTNEVNESIMVKQQDKLKAARIIGMALGYTDAETKNDPTTIVNTALRGMRSKVLNPESRAIISRMMDLAKQMEIKYDDTLLGLKESEEQLEEGVREWMGKIRSKHGKVKFQHHAETNTLVARDENGSVVGALNKGTNESVEDEEKAHNLMHKPGKAQQSNYERVRKIHVKVHESEEEEDFDDDDIEEHLNSISDDDIIEHGYDDEEFESVDESTGESTGEFSDDKSLMEVLSRVERMRAKLRFKKSEAKRERAEKIALKHRSSGAVLAKRARRVAVKTLELKLAKKPLNQLSVSEKERIEARIARMKPAITKMSTRLLSRVREVERTRLAGQSNK